MDWTPVTTLARLGALALVGAPGPLLAGPLDPPAGPITSTYKTLTEVEPRIAVNATNTPGDADSLFKITQPGSYYLTGNITGVVGKHGVEIAASNVTLDLNGFDLAGVPAMGSVGGVVSVSITTIYDQITVLNGSVHGWGAGGGIYLGGSGKCRVSEVRADGNVGHGIRVGPNSVVTGCSAQGNSEDGIRCSWQCYVSNCTANNNTHEGIVVSDGSAVLECQIASNNVGGAGITTGDECEVAHCSAWNCGGNGIATGSGCTVTECTSGNNFKGIVVGPGSTALACTARYNAANGITAGSSCTISTCTANANQGTSGITVGTGSTVTGCTSGGNTGDGIVAGDFSTVSGCTADQNSANGITVSRSCQVRQNSCSGNGTVSGTGSGINLTSILNRLEDNVCNENARGFSASAARNVFVRNTSGSNVLNWNVAAGNHLFVLNASAAAAVSGSSGGTTLSTDPNANFTH